MQITVALTGEEAVVRRISVMTSKKTARELNRHIGNVVLERVKDFLDQMAATRHKTADRLGAPHSKFLEYASGRVAGSPLGQTTQLESADENGALIAIKNTPGLSRAFHDLRITPKKAKALTIPLSRVSYNKRVADLRREGHEIFRPKGTNILAEAKSAKSSKDGKPALRPLYALVHSVTIPKDEGLLPQDSQIRDWAVDAAEGYFEAADLLS